LAGGALLQKMALGGPCGKEVSEYMAVEGHRMEGLGMAVVGRDLGELTPFAAVDSKMDEVGGLYETLLLSNRSWAMEIACSFQRAVG
jgi:hypothetical protein